MRKINLFAAGTPLNRSREDLFERPAHVDTSTNRRLVDARSAAPFGNRMGRAAVCDVPIRSHVVHVLLPGDPSDVTGFVVSVIVDPVDLRFGIRPAANVGDEGCERVRPLVADFNSSAAVVVPLRMVGIRAASSHGVPDFVLGSSGHAVLFGRALWVATFVWSW